MKTTESAVVWIPPENVWEPIQAIRRRYDRHFKEWMPHVTLLYPFRPKASFAEIVPALGQVAARIAAFEVLLETFRSFDHGPRSHTAWIAPSPLEPWRDLVRALVEAFPDCDDTTRYAGGFQPHLSVGQAHSREELAKLLAEARSWSPLRLRVAGMSLIARDAAGVFHVDRQVGIGSCPVS